MKPIENIEIPTEPNVTMVLYAFEMQFLQSRDLIL